MQKYKMNMHKVDFELNQKHHNKSDYINYWNSQEILRATQTNPDQKPMFLLHDGPPYANGDLHLGHFANKTIKDVLLRFKRLNGWFAPFLPGFDCHGLPVELAVEKELGKKDNLKDFVHSCYSYAQTQVANQTRQFKEFGVLGDWDNSYRTINYTSEATEMKVVLDLLGKGFLHQKYRPVYWCKDCQGSLAEAEVDYKTKESDSLTVKFKVANQDNTYLLVWTTTPYTLPANQAVAYNQKYKYSKYTSKDTNEVYVMVADSDFGKAHNLTEDGEFDLFNLALHSPYSQKQVPLVSADYVDSSGTGFVHIAPSFGLDDFQVGEKYNLDTLNYVNEYGKYNCELFSELNGKTLKDTRDYVVERLTNNNLVFNLGKLTHDYPHCWRHKTPLFFKTSKEWFMDLTNVKQTATKSLDDVSFYPPNGKKRLTNMLENRTSWCVSRNRAWGVPLPTGTSETELAEYEKLIQDVEQHGLNAVFNSSKKYQTLDVWFDSGISWKTVSENNFSTHQADVYVEGSDQYRGWFQSSLLLSNALHNNAPYKTILAHGFVVDEKGRKLSKSLGNYVTLQELFKEYSPDVLRLWVMSQDYTKDVCYSKTNMSQALEKYKKFRNTFRFMLQNLKDYDGTIGHELDNLDLWQLTAFNNLKSVVLQEADNYNFQEVLNKLYLFCENLSSTYFDSQKDRLYCLSKNNPRRKATQEVLWYMCINLAKLLNPFIPYSCEEFYLKLKDTGLVNKQGLLFEEFYGMPIEPDCSLDNVFSIKDMINQEIETLRNQLEFKMANELEICLNSEVSDSELEILKLLLGNNYISYNTNSKNTTFKKHNYKKCPRCWNYFPNILDTETCDCCQTAEREQSECISGE